MLKNQLHLTLFRGCLISRCLSVFDSFCLVSPKPVLRSPINCVCGSALHDSWGLFNVFFFIFIFIFGSVKKGSQPVSEKFMAI